MYSLGIKAEYIPRASKVGFLEISREARDVRLYLMACTVTINLGPASASGLVPSNLPRYFWLQDPVTFLALVPISV